MTDCYDVQSLVGDSWTAFRANMTAQATRLHRRGEDAASTRTLYRYLIRKATSRFVAAVAGRVVDATTLEPIAGVDVGASVASDVRSSTTTDSHGHFTIDFLQPGVTYHISVLGYGPPVGVDMPADGADVLNLVLAVSGSQGTFEPACPDCDESTLPDGPHLPPDELFAGNRTFLLQEVEAIDPNEKRGQRRTGLPGSEDTVCPDEELNYQIFFENLPEATAPAQVVEITDDLDETVFDLSSVNLRDVVFPDDGVALSVYTENGLYSDLPSGTGTFGVPIDGISVTPGYSVFFEHFYDEQTGLLTTRFSTLDDFGNPPLDPNAGFLDPTEGGFIAFTVSVLTNASPEGTEVKNDGDIRFDSTTITTNEVTHFFGPCLPDMPKSPIPDDTGSNVPLVTALSWQSSDFTNFDVFFGKAEDFEDDDLPQIVSRHLFNGLALPNTLEPEERYHWRVVARNRFGETQGPVWSFRTASAPDGEFIRGDVDLAGSVDITDALNTLDFLFLGGFAPQCLDAVDSDDSSLMDLSAPLRTLTFLFLGGVDIPGPGPFDCGPDPTSDGLDCQTEVFCQ